MLLCDRPGFQRVKFHSLRLFIHICAFKVGGS